MYSFKDLDPPRFNIVNLTLASSLLSPRGKPLRGPQPEVCHFNEYIRQPVKILQNLGEMSLEIKDYDDT